MPSEPEHPTVLAVSSSSPPNVLVRAGRAMAGLIVRHGLPLSSQASELLAQHKGRLDSYDALKGLYVEEGKVAAQLKGELLKAAGTASDPLMRLQALETLELVDARIRTVNVGVRALPYIGLALDKEPTAAGSEPSEHWLDTFFHLARIRNEEWREDLLARALALAATGDALSVRSLWTIGQLDEQTFHAFAYFRDAAVHDAETAFFPFLGERFQIFSVKVPDETVSQKLATYGHLPPILEEANLIHTFSPFGSGVQRNFNPGERVKFTCGDACVSGTWLKEYTPPALLLTSLGDSIAKLYTPKPFGVASKMFLEWIETIDSATLQRD